MLGIEKSFLKNAVLKHPKLTHDGAEYLYHFYLIFKELKNLKQPGRVVEKIVASKFYENITDQLASKRAQLENGTIDAEQKKASLERIARKNVVLLELTKPYKDHERFLNAMILGSQDLTQGDGVHLLSIHASKGLEYEEVYVIDLMDGRFPNRKLMTRGGSLDEERRLFYVAVTRAKDILNLSFAKFDKIKKSDFVASQFLYEAGMLQKDEVYTMLVEKESEKEKE